MVRGGAASYTRVGVEATAYSSDWRSCGWEWVKTS